MAAIKINNIGGIFPSVSPRNLSADAAQIAENLLASTSEFRPLRNDKVIGSVAITNPKTIYRFDRTGTGAINFDPSQGWFAASDFRSIARWQMNDDTTGRIYYTSENGAVPMRWHNAAGVDRQVGVPAPNIKPTITPVINYTFTREERDLGIASALAKAIKATTTVGFTKTLVGLATNTLGPGWVKREIYQGVQYNKQVLRVFAVDPLTNKIIDTYCTMSPSEATWVFDPSLGGFYGALGAGQTIPSWGSGHSKWWCIPLTGFAEAFDIAPVALKTALMDIDMPGTQGAKKLLTSAQADSFVAKLTEAADKDATAIAPLIKALEAKQQDVASIFDSGGKATLKKEVVDFYSSPSVVAEIENAKDVFAEQIWQYVRTIGSATATPWFER